MQSSQRFIFIFRSASKVSTYSFISKFATKVCCSRYSWFKCSHWNINQRYVKKISESAWNSIRPIITENPLLKLQSELRLRFERLIFSNKTYWSTLILSLSIWKTTSSLNIIWQKLSPSRKGRQRNRCWLN